MFSDRIALIVFTPFNYQNSSVGTFRPSKIHSLLMQIATQLKRMRTSKEIHNIDIRVRHFKHIFPVTSELRQ